MTEVKMLANAEKGKPVKEGPAVILEPYGRGNNAYRWAGERDVFDARSAYMSMGFGKSQRYLTQGVLRGFSMGGAGAWHLGLHIPGEFIGLMPGAGFTTTHGYIAKLPNPLPDYQEKCLRMYDAVLYAENLTRIRTVAYSGELDKQKAAADNIENALKALPGPFRFKHLVAPGLEHKITSEWVAKVEEEYQKLAKIPTPNDFRFVTYSPLWGGGFMQYILAQDKPYEKSVLDVKYSQNTGITSVTTENVRAFKLISSLGKLLIDGQEFPELVTQKEKEFSLGQCLAKVQGKWKRVHVNEYLKEFPSVIKHATQAGPIDAAFMSPFSVVVSQKIEGPTATSIMASHSRMKYEWNKWMRAELPKPQQYDFGNRVIFGDYTSPEVQKILPKLPITWTAEKLVVNGVEYDPKTHYPVMIYPDSEKTGSCIVLNSGHTFHEKEFQGTNAGLYPRLGDWAVLKVAPTKEDPANTETVAAGLFDADWKFTK
ncbi:MAG: alpha/beta hydrolase family protein [Fimbriiglobus sp.]